MVNTCCRRILKYFLEDLWRTIESSSSSNIADNLVLSLLRESDKPSLSDQAAIFQQNLKAVEVALASSLYDKR